MVEGALVLRDAALTREQVREVLEHPLPTFTPNTIADAAALEAVLVDVRKAGWASVHEELEVGLNAAAVPVRDSSGKVVAALSVSGPSYRLKPAQFGVVWEMTVAAAAAISRRLGHVG